MDSKIINNKIDANKEFIPFVEKYRPTQFDDIVLEPINKAILNNIIKTNYFPNLLFYGPPGTGKTTTIINLINTYQYKNSQNKELIIHLNASDERGIDIIRNQINNFVNSKPLFNNGTKFVILDEVDYMTKNAQQALKYLLQDYNPDVRFCLICNYISKIDIGLQNELIHLRFNQLPKDKIIQFLQNISVCENLNLSTEILENIQKLYHSDIRSMINFIQSNTYIDNNVLNIIEERNLEILFFSFKENREKDILKHINDMVIKYNTDSKNILKNFINYIIQKKTNYINNAFLDFVENLLYSQVQNERIFVNYAIYKLKYFLHDL